MKCFLLDTHIFIWFLNGEESLPLEIRGQINDAISRGKLYLSAISVWEVAMLVQKKRITLTMPTLDWVNALLQKPGVNLIPLSPEIAVESCHLPGECHGDPADRILIATARLHKLHLITRDNQILDYAAANYIHCLPA